MTMTTSVSVVKFRRRRSCFVRSEMPYLGWGVERRGESRGCVRLGSRGGRLGVRAVYIEARLATIRKKSHKNTNTEPALLKHVPRSLH